MPSRPILSIVIPSHRRTDFLEQCLTSILRHAPAMVETIVVDDGSPKAQVSETSLRFPCVRVVRWRRSRGFCAAANHGIAAARCSIIQLLNDDTQVDAGWAEAALACFSNPSVGAVAPLVMHGVPNQPNPQIDSAGDGYDPGGFAWKIGRGRKVSTNDLQGRSVSCASGSSVFLRRSALERTGLFPEHFGAYFEDVDLSLRLTQAGYRIQYEPASRVWHRGGGSYGHPSRRLVERQSCNEERLYWRQLRRTRDWRTIGRHLAVLGGKAIRRCREGAILPFLLGRIRAFAEIRQMLFNKEDRTCPNLPPLGPS